MKYRDYYEILGLQRAATQDEIRRAYRKLARNNREREAGAQRMVSIAKCR